MWSLKPIQFDQIVGWAEDDHKSALAAFGRQIQKPKSENYRCGSIGIDPSWFEPLVTKAHGWQGEARHFFEEHFDAYSLFHSEAQRGRVTGFYEPEVAASLERSEAFAVPIYRRPADLVAVNDENRPNSWDNSYRFGRLNADSSVSEYFDRAQIQAGALDNQGLEIAYVENLVEAFFIHVQGAARLRLEDGSLKRITFDGKSGHPFTAIGRLLIEMGEIDSSTVSMQSIKKWLFENPDRAQPLMEKNRSYIFFKEVDVKDPSLGPIAAAKIQLTAGRSLAVDRLLHSFSTPIFVSADSVNQKPFQQLMIAQETGTAIVGPARGDIFFGSGDEAGEKAGAVNSPCDFFLLVPKDAPFDPNGARFS